MRILPILWGYLFSIGISCGFELGLAVHPQDVPFLKWNRLSVPIRTGLRWHLVEKGKAEYSFRGSGLELLFEANNYPVLWHLDYGNKLHVDGWIDSEVERKAFGDYAQWAARNFEGAVDGFEVWNEWDFGFGGPEGPGSGGDPVDYVRLLEQSYGAIKGINPKLKVIGGAISSDGFGEWLTTACEEGLLDSLDVLSIHPYHSRHGGDYRYPEVGLRLELQRVYEAIEPYKKGQDMPIWLTELGYHTSAVSFGYSLADQAKVIARAVLLAWADPRIGSVFYYKAIDDTTNALLPARNMGLLFADGTPKPSLSIFKEIEQWIELGAEIRVIDDFGFGWAGLEVDESERFKRIQESKQLSVPLFYALEVYFPGKAFLNKWVLWTVFPEDRVRIVVEPIEAQGGYGRSISIERLGEGTAYRVFEENGSYPITITDSPLVIEAQDWRGMTRTDWSIRSARVLSSRERPIVVPESGLKLRPLLLKKATDKSVTLPY